MSKITPCLWYTKNAAEAAEYYASIFPDSRVDNVTTFPMDSPGGEADTGDIVEFTLFGQPFMAFSSGPLDEFNHAISFTINCDNQEEVDRYWDALCDGGTPEQCGWVRDRYGVAWQVTPTVLGKLMADPDREKAKRVGEAMLEMEKLDIAALEAAAAS